MRSRGVAADRVQQQWKWNASGVRIFSLFLVCFGVGLNGRLEGDVASGYMQSAGHLPYGQAESV
jgi:hypothetical protein